MYIPPFDLYFFATLAMFLLPIAYAITRSKFILAIFIIACLWDTFEFYINEDFWITPAFMALVGFIVLVWQIFNEPEKESSQEFEMEVQGPGPRMHPKFKPMLHFQPRLTRVFVVTCPHCGDTNSLPEGTVRTICGSCRSLFEISR